jgi:hypothetical protein
MSTQATSLIASEFCFQRCDRGYSLHLLLRLSGRPDLVHPRPGIAVRLSCEGIIILFELKPLEESQPLAWCIVSADSEAEARQAANDQSTRSRSCRLACSRDSRVQASGANWWIGASERCCRFFSANAQMLPVSELRYYSSLGPGLG